MNILIEAVYNYNILANILKDKTELKWALEDSDTKLLLKLYRLIAWNRRGGDDFNEYADMVKEELGKRENVLSGKQNKLLRKAKAKYRMTREQIEQQLPVVWQQILNG